MNLSGTRLFLDDRAAQRKGHRLILDAVFTGLIISLLIGAFVEQTPSFIGKMYLSMLMAPVSEGRLKIIEHHAVSGDWLDETEPGREYFFEKNCKKSDNEQSNLSARVGHIQQGAVHIEVRNRKKNHLNALPEWWSLRPAATGDDAPTVLWVCGSRLPPAGFHTLGENLTTIPQNENFRFCQ
jgi:hypothetical protein